MTIAMHQVIAASEEVGGLAVILPPLYEIFWSAVVLLSVLLLVGKFALPRLYAAMDERQAKIEEGLAFAEKAKEDQARVARDREDALKQANIEAHEIREKASQEAQGIIADARVEAQNEATRILENAQRQILAEKQAAEISLRSDVGLLATELAEKIVGEHLSDTALTSRVVDRFLDDLEADTLRESELDARAVGEDFFSITDLVKKEPRVIRAFTDPSRSGDDKAQLVRTLLSSHLTTDASLSVLQMMVREHWSNLDSFADTTEVLGILAVLSDANRASSLDRVESELFEVRHFLEDNRELRLKLSDASLGTSHERGDLATAIFESKLSVWTMRLLRRAVGRSRRGRLLLLEKRFNSEISLAISVVPGLVGGFKLRAQTTSIDASLSTRISDMKQALAS